MDFCYLDGICTPNGMFIFIILVIHRETGGKSQLGLSYQINEENTPNIRYLANYLKNIHTINLILNVFHYENIFCSIYPLIIEKVRNQNSQLGSLGSAARLGWGFHTPPF